MEQLRQQIGKKKTPKQYFKGREHPTIPRKEKSKTDGECFKV